MAQKLKTLRAYKLKLSHYIGLISRFFSLKEKSNAGPVFQNGREPGLDVPHADEKEGSVLQPVPLRERVVRLDPLQLLEDPCNNIKQFLTEAGNSNLTRQVFTSPASSSPCLT